MSIASPIAGETKTHIGPLDSGSSRSLASQEIAEPNFELVRDAKRKWDTSAGVFTTKHKAVVQSVTLPEFTKHRVIDDMPFRVAPNLGSCDFVCGRDFLFKCKIDVMFSTRKVVWDDIEVDVKNHGHWCPERLAFWNSYNEESHRIRELMDGNDSQLPNGFSKPSNS